MIVLLDNYDSFTYNLFQYISELGEEVVVLRNNETSISEIENYSPSHLVISPGPSNPENAGISNDSIQHFSKKIPVLGVCLGHQCLGNTYGANIIQAEEIMHGKISKITHDGKGLFDGVPNPFKAVRYHSLIIDEDSLPNNFEITARSESGIIQGIRHKSLSLEGVQFHPESIETEHGKKILNNFLKMK
ncbi:MAG: anthranilate/aminodeoxychorismate synthase component II [Chloroflexi bacterium]|nr:anthranilate/aminodeoxychorismate synthase component II [Chloroflexota bacterium]MBL07426.1 anthranilate/aminodeoxychorismate synthase component II [Chloroflexota bacterium]|tara:strand:- start:13978 stop:14544 length:567 start_codon:yes stop_codon:yes gene_type:complete